MKRLLLLLLIPAIWSSCSMESTTENPRGVYKMTKLIGKMGEIDSPYDQYQICTDSITMLCTSENGWYRITDKHQNTLNYTGPNPKDSTDKSTLIYDSNERVFTLKWWSEYDNHIYFPKNDWCIEKYEANLYSEKAKPFFEVLMNEQNIKENKNPYLGTWRLVQTYHPSDSIYTETMDENGNVIQSGKISAIEHLLQNKDYVTSLVDYPQIQHPIYCHFTPSQMLYFRFDSPKSGTGLLHEASYNDKGFVLNRIIIYDVTRLSDDCIVATNVEPDGSVTHDVMIREKCDKPLISRIADYFI